MNSILRDSSVRIKKFMVTREIGNFGLLIIKKFYLLMQLLENKFSRTIYLLIKTALLLGSVSC